MDKVLCDVDPLEVCDVLLGQPYLWKHHDVYDSSTRTVIITLGRKLYRILKVAMPIFISLISAKKCNKIISNNGKFVFFYICYKFKGKIVATSIAPIKDSSM